MQITKKELEVIIKNWADEFVKVRGIFWLYKEIYTCDTSEKKQSKNKILKEYKNFFIFSKKAYLDTIIINLEKFFQKNKKKYNSYFTIKKYAEEISSIDFSEIEKKYNNIRESRNKITHYRNHELAHFQKNKKTNNILHVKDIDKLINFVLEFLNFILFKIFNRENDFGNLSIKRLLKRETEFMFKKLESHRIQPVKKLTPLPSS